MSPVVFMMANGGLDAPLAPDKVKREDAATFLSCLSIHLSAHRSHPSQSPSQYVGV
jgi:hypothetical protein